jgi:hypothetical protein
MSTREQGSTRLRVGLAAVVALACVGVGVVAFADDHDPNRRAATPQDPDTAEQVVLSHDDSAPVPTGPVKERKLRPGEQRTALQMDAPYTPSPPTGKGTDDYRCFLLDPDLPEDAWLTGTQILPGNPDVVHHVILFRVDGSSVAQARAEDDASPEPGWTCFGGMGLEGEFSSVDDAGWLGAWAPGGRETVARKGYGVSLDSDTQIVMQVHYNLLKGSKPDRSSTQIRWTPKAGSDIQGVHTTLLPAPVELPCRPDHALGALCDREASVEDAKERFGEGTGQLANLLHLLCGTNVYPTQTTSCTRTIPRSMTILGAAGHMHLLGRWIRIEANPGTADATEVLDIPLWNFDDQAAQRIEPLHLDAGDELRVTCHHTQELRDLLPAFDGTQEKYVVWGEGTTDEMCLGILQVVFDDDV